MKKRIVWIAALLLIAAGLMLVIDRDKKRPVEPIEPHAARDFMRASLTYDEGLRTLRGTQTIQAENRTGEALDEIVLRLYMNANSEEGVAVSGVSVNGEAVKAAQDADDSTVVRIDYPWQSGERIELSWTVMIKHPKTDGAAVITLPQLAMAENGAWRTDTFDDLVDPSYAQAFDYVLDMIVKDSTKAAFGGQIVSQRWETGIGETLYAVQMRMARDASFALMPKGKTQEKEISGVRALSQDSGTAKKLLEAAQTALESLDEIGIAYPLDTLTIVDGETARADGAVYSGLIALEADTDKETLIRKLTRLIARQTFGILVENDPWNAPWLSETLASSVEMLAFRARKGAAAYEERLYGELELATRITRPVGVSVGASTAHFGSDSEMEQVLRDQGAAMLLGIEQAVGADAFVTALEIYAGDNMGETGSLEALLEAFELTTGSSWDGYISDMLAF